MRRATEARVQAEKRLTIAAENEAKMQVTPYPNAGTLCRKLTNAVRTQAIRATEIAKAEGNMRVGHPILAYAHVPLPRLYEKRC